MSEDQSEVSEPTIGEALDAAYEANVAEPEEKPVVEVEEKVEASPEVESESVSEDVAVETETESIEETVEVSPPEHWSDEDKQAFQGMDEGGREWALRLETNASRGIEKKSAELKTFRDAFEPYKHLFPEGAEIPAMQQLFNAQLSLQQNPVEGIKWLMRNFGVDEKQFAPSAEPVDEFQDPEVAQLRAELKDIRDTSVRNSQAAVQRQQNAMISEINQFRDAEKDGEVLHPHFNAVSGVMAGLMQSGRADSLEEAYKQALWSEPEYRDSVIEEKAKEQAKKTLEERTRKADKADKASKSVTGKNAATTTTKPKTLTESLEEAYEKSVRGET